MPGLSTLAQAQVYKWINTEGNPVYGDMPPAGVDAELIRKKSAVPKNSSGSASAPEPASIGEYLDKLERQPATGQGRAASGQSRGAATSSSSTSNTDASRQAAGTGGQSRSANQTDADGQSERSDDKEYDSNPFDGTPARKLSEQEKFIEQRNKRALQQHSQGQASDPKTLSEKKIQAQQ